MKILFIVPSYKPAYIYGGAIYAVSALCEALEKKGHSITVFTTNANGACDLPVPVGKPVSIEGVTVLYFRRRSGDHGNFTPGLLKAFWQEAKNFDVVHVISWWNFIATPVLQLCAWKKIVPILSPHGSITQYTVARQKTVLKRFFHKLLGKRLLERAVIHVTTSQELQNCESLFKPDAVFIIHNLHQLYTKVEMDRPTSDKLRLLYFGRIEPKKNVEFLINMLSDETEIPLSLTIVGDGDAEYIESLKQKTVGMKSITWHEPIHSEEKWRIMADSDILVLPSFNENYAMVVIEALSQGTPVLISDQVGLKDYVEDNSLGWVLPNDPIKWRSTLQYIWENPSVLKTIREKAPVAIQQHFSIDKLTRDYIDMYQQVQQLNREQ